MSIIEDGTGKGYQAKVTKENKLETKSVTYSEISEVSQRAGKAFQIHYKRTLVAANTFEVVGHLEYTGTATLIIDSCSVSKEDANLTSANGQALYEFAFGPTYTSGGNTQEAFSLNSSSTETLSITSYSGLTTVVIDESNKEKLLDIVTEDTVRFDFKDAFILKKGDTFSIKGKGKNIGDILHLALFVYEIED
jgi:hypothetical protein